MPEPIAVTVQPTVYTVSCLPEDDIHYRFFQLTVERDQYGWSVNDGHSYRCLNADGTWDHRGASAEKASVFWVEAHRFDLDTALRLARKAAPHVTFNGRTVAEALRKRATKS